MFIILFYRQKQKKLIFLLITKLEKNLKLMQSNLIVMVIQYNLNGLMKMMTDIISWYVPKI